MTTRVHTKGDELKTAVQPETVNGPERMNAGNKENGHNFFTETNPIPYSVSAFHKATYEFKQSNGTPENEPNQTHLQPVANRA
jgi:hypothetical protein